MEVEIKPEILAAAELDTAGFKTEMRRTLSVESAVLNNLRITDNQLGVKDTLVKDTILNFTDWESVLAMLDNREIIRFRICGTSYKDKIQYTPGVIDENKFIFKEDKTSGDMIIVINDLLPINLLLEAWINRATNTYAFGLKPKWTPWSQQR
jgi:hypothetical protein